MSAFTPPAPPAAPATPSDRGRRRLWRTYREEQQARRKRRRACEFAASIAPHEKRNDLDLAEHNKRWPGIDFETREEATQFYARKLWPWRQTEEDLCKEDEPFMPPAVRRLPRDVLRNAMETLRYAYDDALTEEVAWETDFAPPNPATGFAGGEQFSKLHCRVGCAGALDTPSPNSRAPGGTATTTRAAETTTDTTLTSVSRPEKKSTL